MRKILLVIEQLYNSILLAIVTTIVAIEVCIVNKVKKHIVVDESWLAAYDENCIV